MVQRELCVSRTGRSARDTRFLEIHQSFTDHSAWQKWFDRQAELTDNSYIAEVARSILGTGFIDPWRGAVHRSEIEASSDNYREGLVAGGLSSKHRAVMRLVLEYGLLNGYCSPIYLSEHLSSFAQTLIRSFRYTVTSEYLPNPAMRRRHFRIHHQDPLRLTLPDHSFDLYLSLDRMIYAPDMFLFMKEARRVLRRGGQLLATFPFRYGEEKTEVRAMMKPDGIEHLQPARLEEDHLDSSRQQLIFFVPGWDILDASRQAGFRDAEIIAISSRTSAILGAEIALIFVLRATV